MLSLGLLSQLVELSRGDAETLGEGSQRLGDFGHFRRLSTSVFSELKFLLSRSSFSKTSSFVAITIQFTDQAKKKAKVPNMGVANIATWQVGGRAVLAPMNFIKPSNKLSEQGKWAKHS